MRSASVCEAWEGRTIDGKFPLLEWLGGWADQCVFLTVRQGMQTANIKLVLASGADADAYLTKWEAARTLSHPDLVQVMEGGQCAVDEKQVVYVVTERAETVLSGMIPGKALSSAEMKSILKPIVDALSYIHEKGFVHGRLKPSNIVQVSGQWKLSVEELVGTGDSPKPSGEAGIYDAPEVAAGTYSPASDVWSLGMIVIEAFAHRSPDSRTVRDGFVPDSVPEPFREIARRCVRTNPANRCSLAEVKTLLGGRESQPVVEPVPQPVIAVSAPQILAEPVVHETKTEIVEEQAAAVKEPERVADEEEYVPEPMVEPALPFEDAEPIELTPRSRLFANIEEEEDEPKSRAVPILMGIIILLGIAAVIGVREYRIKILSLGNVLNPPATQPSSPTQAPAQPNASGAQSTTPPGQSATQPQSPAQAPNTPPAGQAGSQPQSPTQAQNSQPPSPPPAQTQPPSAATSAGDQNTPPPSGQQSQPPSQATQPAANPASSAQNQSPEPAPAKTEPKREKPARPANAAGEVLKRVLPRVSPGASEGMRGPVEVQIRVWVNEHGAVSNAEYATHGPGNYFARVAREAARSWKFNPPEREGHPRASVWNLRFRFERRNVDATATELR